MAVGKGTPGSPQHSPSNHSGPAHTPPPLRGLGAAERWAQPGPRAGLAKLNSHRPVLGAEELGKVSPHQTPKTSQAGSSLGSRVPIPRQEAGAPNPPSRAPPHLSPLPLSGGGWGLPPPYRSSAAQKLGAPPGHLPAPAPPHLRRAAPCSAPGRPQRSTGAPPGSSPRAATRSRPARPRLRGAPGPTGPRPARVGGAARGRGPRGVPAPGADTRRHPASREAGRAHAGAAPRNSGSTPPRPEGRSARDSAAAAGHPLPLPGPRGQRQLVIVRAQRARRQGGRPSPSAPPVEACPARHTLRLWSPERGAEGQLPPHPPRLSCPAPQERSGTQARAVPARPPPDPAVDGGIFGLAEVAPPGDIFGEYTVTPSTLGARTRFPSSVPSRPREPRPAPGAAVCSPAFLQNHLFRESSLLG